MTTKIQRAEHKNAIVKLVKQKRMILQCNIASVMNSKNIPDTIATLVKDGKLKRQKIQVRGPVGNLTNQWLIYDNSVKQNDILDFERQTVNKTFQSPLVENHCYKSPEMPIEQKLKSNVVDMIEYIKINNTDLGIKEYKGKRVVTFKEIDELHERPTGTARQTFNRNKKHFREGRDYFVCLTYEAQNMGIKAPNGLKLFTEQGYLLLVKPFSDDLSWDIQKDLVDNYFQMRVVKENLNNNLPVTKENVDLSNPFDILKVFATGITDLNDRVKTLESTIESLKNAITA